MSFVSPSVVGYPCYRFLEGLLLRFVSRLDLHTWSRINSQMHCLVSMKLFWHWPRINLEELTLELKQQSVLSIRLQLLSYRYSSSPRPMSTDVNLLLILGAKDLSKYSIRLAP